MTASDASTILVINAGSSSIKFATFSVMQGQAPETLVKRASLAGQIEGIGTPKAHLTAKDHEGARLADLALEAGADDHAQALAYLLDWLVKQPALGTIAAIGHRIVHGADDYSSPIRLDQTVIDRLAEFVHLAPLHQPHNLAGVRALATIMPDIPQVACFDTAMHQTQPWVATAFGLPRRFTQAGIKRYGFHGLSYEYIATVLPQHTDRSCGRVVVAHLGNGASMTALVDGRSIATSMGFTPLDGLMMGTRPGYLDPGVLLHMMDHLAMDVPTLSKVLYKESGLLGVSGVSQDMRALLASDDPHAQEAVDLFIYRIVRELGSLAAASAGIDVFVFTGGIGENSPLLRQRICQDSAWLGIALDDTANSRGQFKISTPDSAIEVFVIPTNEEWMIASHTLRCIAPSTSSP
jgi:acetate kinase